MFCCEVRLEAPSEASESHGTILEMHGATI